MDEKVNDEVTVFFPDGKLKLSSGEEIDVPKLSWKVEARAVKIIGRIFKSVPELSALDLNNVTGKNLLAIIPTLLEKVPDAITELTCLLIKKDQKFVEDQLNHEDVLAVIIPFSVALSGMLRKLAGVVTPDKEATVKEAPAAPSQK